MLIDSLRSANDPIMAIPQPPPPPKPAGTTIKSEDHPREKKSRIRHSEAQLIALNELYEENKHPSLEDRASLAEALGMETKTVNAWFANKRSATKKKTKGTNNLQSPTPRTGTPQTVDEDEDEWAQVRSAFSTPPPANEPPPIHIRSTLRPDGSEHSVVFDGEGGEFPRRIRIRPSTWQNEELRKLYAITSHPSREQREELGNRISMRYQSITNWFQNQRSLAKRRREAAGGLTDDEPHNTSTHSLVDSDAHSIPDHSSPHLLPSRRGSPIPHIASSPGAHVRQHPLAISHTPVNFRTLAAHNHLSRPRRTRPEPFQLEALKQLFAKTPNPSIEERGALALAIGMDLGKVTNWFRNLRQTARKRAQKIGDGDGDDDSAYFDSVPVSRAGSPSAHYLYPHSSSSSTNGDSDNDHMDVDLDDVRRRHMHHSDGGSDYDYQEAVTPPSDASPSPPPPANTRSRRMDVGFLTGATPHEKSDHFFAKSSDAPTGVRVEDALLLLSFSRHTK